MKKMKYILLMMMVLLLTACGSKAEENDKMNDDTTSKEVTEETTEESEAEKVKILGTFTSWTLDGEEVTDEIFAEADLTMVNIWGTFCGPCIKEMPDLGEISREYEDKGVQVVGIISDVEEPEDDTALEIIDQTKADYTHLIASDDLVMNVLQYVSAVPMTIFVDKDGYMVGELYSGARDKETWELIINQCLTEVK